MKNTLFLLICFLASLPASPAFSQPSARIAGGPYLQNVTEDGFTVIWTTTDAAAWVETAPDDGTHFYAVERPKYYDSHLGRRRLGKLHRVRVGGLEPGKTYRYRIMQRGIVLNEGNRRVILDDGDGSEVYRRKPYTIRTLDPAQEKVDFWMVNDIHARDSVFQLLIKEAPEAQPDFVCLNGDLASQTETEQTLWDACLGSASKILTPAGIPLAVTRGNHENRGAYAQHRVRTLAVNMIVTMTIPWFFLHPAFVVHSTNNPAAHMTISVIALIFNAGVFIYQAYTIFGKKRNPFKQELYIDNPRFRRVYLESIDVPEGQREAALANLEEFGYAAAWDEKGRVKTMVERP